MASKSSQSAKSSKNNLSFILYEGDSAPRFFNLRKSTIKFLIYSLPIVTFISVLLLSLGIFYFKELAESAKEQHPQIITDLRQELEAINSRNNDLETFNQELQSRLAEGVSLDLAGMETLSLFRPVAGMQNLTATPQLSIENQEVSVRGGDINLSFHIVNQTPDNERLSGYLFVLMKQPESIHIYPREVFSNQSFQLSFTSGESFATQRFRPVDNIRFPMSSELSRGLFQVIIFSRTGDLLYKEIFSMDIE